MTAADAPAKMVKEAVAAFGPSIHIIINNAGDHGTAGLLGSTAAVQRAGVICWQEIIVNPGQG